VKVAIVGCGTVAKKHISFIADIKNAEITALMDNNKKALETYAWMYGIQGKYTNIGRMIREENPDVVHILTPPDTHEELALKVLRKKKHVYVEKPIALNLNGAKNMYRLAHDSGAKLCPGYNHLFDPCMLKAEERIKDSDRFGRVVFVESFYGMNVNRDDLKRTDRNGNPHWSYGLPGGLFHNYLDHPLYVLLKYTGKPLRINASTRCYGSLPQNLADELYIFIQGTKANGFLTLSFVRRPLQHFAKIYGEKQCALINFDTMTTCFYRDSVLPKALSKATTNLSEALSLTTSTFSNAANLLRGRLRPYQGMKDLISEFYKSIAENLPSPVPKSLVLDVAETIEAVWSQVNRLDLESSPIPARQTFDKTKDKLLITGASGFVGRRLVNKLVQEGYYVRAFVRKLSFTKELERLGVDIHFGDIRDIRTFGAVMNDVDCVVHLAAATHGDYGDSYDITVTGAKNLIQLAREIEIRKIIYMSSMSVYEVNSVKPRSVLDETHELERNMQARGTYSWSKGEAERLILEAMNKNKTAVWKILRPAMIFGNGSDPFLPPLGVSIRGRINIIFGTGREKIRLVHVDDVVDAINLLIEEKGGENKIYNVISPEMLTKKEYINLIIKKIFPKSSSLYVPHGIIKTGILMGGVLAKLLQKSPPLTLYRYNASQRDVVFEGSLISRELGWHPHKKIKERLEETFT